MIKFPKLTVISFQEFFLVPFYEKMSPLILETNIQIVLTKKKGILETWPQNLQLELRLRFN